MSDKKASAPKAPDKKAAALEPTIEEHASSLQVEPGILAALKRANNLGAGKRMARAEFDTLVRGVLDGPLNQRRPSKGGK